MNKVRVDIAGSRIDLSYRMKIIARNAVDNFKTTVVEGAECNIITDYTRKVKFLFRGIRKCYKIRCGSFGKVQCQSQEILVLDWGCSPPEVHHTLQCPIHLLTLVPKSSWKATSNHIGG
ncbi:hypothetical protein Q3G72_024672 [Acer saccharum]|nr:hypothetical protein Q3G72_024672 [Acer saccharum]